ncbi:MAG: hypothetical protein ABGZ23_09060 [Fuerstiella sp.]
MSRIENLPDELCQPKGFISDLVQYMDDTAEFCLRELQLATADCPQHHIARETATGKQNATALQRRLSVASYQSWRI